MLLLAILGAEWVSGVSSGEHDWMMFRSLMKQAWGSLTAVIGHNSRMPLLGTHPGGLQLGYKYSEILVGKAFLRS